jgi:hypothetical protein
VLAGLQILARPARDDDGGVETHRNTLSDASTDL